ncbi:PEP-CTERM sorting domain-containing protein [Altererythrobacter sp. FM1]|uniref:PEP-CTERM sorting domain-containing protein n=1 Tax=Tsuneonella flava TaxID=2055955 RepID=A0ABX7K8P0_9SPHN|nr:PEP-CTERM sorting domain-containing protein [Tsuneonella flava]QSB43634.1 PEP-CTERM sorting domain-containing protein [Tsuneonella flava]ROT95645.1 PEP-CTERM sorting domain-containing protein [Altererythrobacter sp. FM1]
MRYIPAIVLLATATPAFAATAAVPEPGSMTLFAMGVIGLIVGRQAAKKRRDRD